MVSRAKCRSDPQLFPEFAGELGRELRASIRYYLSWKTVLIEYIVLEEHCGFFHHYRFLARGDNDPLG